MRILDGVLTPGELARVRHLIERGQFVCGRDSAAGAAGAVKSNQQMQVTPEVAQPLAALVIDALKRDQRFHRCALAVEISMPTVNRYEIGMSYGPHYDSLLFAAANGTQMRADLSVTLFLSAPEEYDGGELVDCASGRSFKLPAGDMVIYPTGLLHEVKPVTRGTRYAIIFWVQSMIQDHAQRRLLCDLDFAIEKVSARLPESEELLSLSGVFANLGRMWVKV